MSIFSFISNIFKPATDLVDNLHTSTEEKLELRNKLAEVQESANAKLVELEKARLEAISKVQVAEAGSKYAITATWRPICSMIIVAIVLLASFDLAHPNEQFYELAKVFLGVYGSGRSLEKLGSVLKLGK